MAYDPYRALEITSGFLVVMRFDALYETYAPRYKGRRGRYAIPRTDLPPSESSIKYRGLDRDALDANDVKPLRLADLFLADLENSGQCVDGFLFSDDDVKAVLSWLGDDLPRYEVVWARRGGASDDPPADFESLGFEPTYFISDHFSASCDCMLFPRWHGTDDEGVLFLEHFRRLNAHGLFQTPGDAQAFLDQYLSVDWTEHAGPGYVIAEVFGRINAVGA